MQNAAGAEPPLYLIVPSSSAAAFWSDGKEVGALTSTNDLRSKISRISLKNSGVAMTTSHQVSSARLPPIYLLEIRTW